MLKAINLVRQSEGSMFQRHCEEVLRMREQVVWFSRLDSPAPKCHCRLYVEDEGRLILAKYRNGAALTIAVLE